MHLLASLVLGAVLLTRAPVLARRPGPPRCLLVALSALTATELLQLDPVRNRLGLAPGTDTVLKHALTLLAAGAVHSLLRAVEKPETKPAWRRPHLLLGALALASLALPYLLVAASDVPNVISGAGGRRDLRGDVSLLVSWAGFLGYLTIALVGSARVCVTYGRSAGRGPTRRGLTLTGTGAVVGLLLVATKLLLLARWSLGHPVNVVTDDDALEDLIVGSSVVLIAAGSSWEALERLAVTAAEIVRGARAMRRLYPLWLLTREEAPSAILFPYTRRTPLPCRLGTARYLLVRRVTEIEDGLRALSLRITPEVYLRAFTAARSAARSDRDAEVVAFAACLHLARDPATSRPQASPPSSPILPSWTGEDTIARLLALAGAYDSRSARVLACGVSAAEARSPAGASR